MWEGLTRTIVAGNELWRVVGLLLILLVSMLAGRLVRYAMERSARRPVAQRREWVPVMLRALARSVTWLSIVLGLQFGLAILRVETGITPVIALVSKILNATAVGYAIYCMVDVVDFHLGRFAARTASKVDDVLVPMIGRSIRITIFVLVTVNVVHVVSGKNVATLLAGLGVGGLAVALAGQETIKNFFGSVVILSDRLFEIGDRIAIGDQDGVVEQVGFRSTRIRALDGELVTIPNAEMVNTAVRNMGKRAYLKRTMNIALTYDTPPAKVERAVTIVREALAGHEGMAIDMPPRVHFTDFTDWALNVRAVYWYHPADYWKFTEFSERVNLMVLRRFEEEGIAFAFPTQTVLVGAGVASPGPSSRNRAS